MNENDDVRANVGCQNGVDATVRVNIELFGPDGTSLETKFMDLAPWSNNQINRIFRNYAPVNGYVDIWTTAPDATIYCYGSVLDNLTSDRPPCCRSSHPPRLSLSGASAPASFFGRTIRPRRNAS